MYEFVYLIYEAENVCIGIEVKLQIEEREEREATWMNIIKESCIMSYDSVYRINRIFLKVDNYFAVHKCIELLFVIFSINST